MSNETHLSLMLNLKLRICTEMDSDEIQSAIESALQNVQNAKIIVTSNTIQDACLCNNHCFDEE